jgi:hypothetical protein
MRVTTTPHAGQECVTSWHDGMQKGRHAAGQKSSSRMQNCASAREEAVRGEMGGERVKRGVRRGERRPTQTRRGGGPRGWTYTEPRLRAWLGGHVRRDGLAAVRAHAHGRRVAREAAEVLRLLRLDDDDLLLHRLAHHDLRLLRVVLLRLLRLLRVVPGWRRPGVGLLLLLLRGLRVVLRLRDDVLRLPAALNVLRLHLGASFSRGMRRRGRRASKRRIDHDEEELRKKESRIRPTYRLFSLLILANLQSLFFTGSL